MANAFKFKTLGESFIRQHPKSWIIENVIAENETSSWFGPPGAGKSALLAEISHHVITGRDWRNYKVSKSSTYDKRGVLYFALERADLTERRMLAHAYRDGLPANLPFAIVSEPLNLLDPACVEQVVKTVSAFESSFGENMEVGVALIVIDTHSKAIAGGDEDKAQTQNVAALHLQQIHDELIGTAHIATIGHSGKNLSAGERGSNARTGHVDLAVQISGDKVRTATIVKANDRAHGPLTTFAIEEFHVSNDFGDGIDRDAYTVAIVAPDTLPAEDRPAAPKPPSGKQTRALDALRQVIAERGNDGAVHVDFWKEALTKAGLMDTGEQNPRDTFAKIRKGLAQHVIADSNGLVRFKPQPGNLNSVAVV